jgi:predicted metal-dependent phosphoesterase TrpH
MRCDLHVHSKHSGSAGVPLLPGWLECYSEPAAVYDTARARGMDLVTLTDHDSIEGALALRNRPNTFVSEEVTVVLDGGRELHFGVYGIDETQHAQIESRRRDGESLVAYLAGHDIPFAVNHLFSPLTGRRTASDLVWALSVARLLETGNAMLPAVSNRIAEEARQRIGAGAVGGSDAHALRFVGRSYTVVSGARTAGDFIQGLRMGHATAEGEPSDGIGLTRDVLQIAAAGARHGIRSARGARRALRALAFLASAPFWIPTVCASVAWSRLREHTSPRLYAFALERAARREGLTVA